MSQPVYAVYKNGEKESDYPGLAQACAVWANDPTGKKVVKLNQEGKILEEIATEECEMEAKIFNSSHPEQPTIGPVGPVKNSFPESEVKEDAGRHS